MPILAIMDIIGLIMMVVIPILIFSVIIYFVKRKTDKYIDNNVDQQGLDNRFSEENQFSEHNVGVQSNKDIYLALGIMLVHGVCLSFVKYFYQVDLNWYLSYYFFMGIFEIGFFIILLNKNTKRTLKIIISFALLVLLMTIVAIWQPIVWEGIGMMLADFTITLTIILVVIIGMIGMAIGSRVLKKYSNKLNYILVVGLSIVFIFNSMVVLHRIHRFENCNVLNSQKDECYELQAKSGRNVNACVNIKNEYDKQDCYKKAIFYDDEVNYVSPRQCDVIQNESDREWCYLNFVQTVGDEESCVLLKNTKSKIECYRYVISTKCYKLRDGSPYGSKELQQCVDNAIKKKREQINKMSVQFLTQYTEQINDCTHNNKGSKREICYNNIAKHGNFGGCDLIGGSNKLQKAGCYYYGIKDIESKKNDVRELKRKKEGKIDLDNINETSPIRLAFVIALITLIINSYVLFEIVPSEEHIKGKKKDVTNTKFRFIKYFKKLDIVVWGGAYVFLGPFFIGAFGLFGIPFGVLIFLFIPFLANMANRKYRINTVLFLGINTFVYMVLEYFFLGLGEFDLYDRNGVCSTFQVMAFPLIGLIVLNMNIIASMYIARAIRHRLSKSIIKKALLFPLVVISIILWSYISSVRNQSVELSIFSKCYNTPTNKKIRIYKKSLENGKKKQPLNEMNNISTPKSILNQIKSNQAVTIPAEEKVDDNIFSNNQGDNTRIKQQSVSVKKVDLSKMTKREQDLWHLKSETEKMLPRVKQCVEKGGVIKNYNKNQSGNKLCSVDFGTGNGWYGLYSTCSVSERAGTEWKAVYNGDNWSYTLECDRYPECSGMENIRCTKEGCVFSEKCK